MLGETISRSWSGFNQVSIHSRPPHGDMVGLEVVKTRATMSARRGVARNSLRNMNLEGVKRSPYFYRRWISTNGCSALQLDERGDLRHLDMRRYVHDSLTPVASIHSWILHCTVLNVRCNRTKLQLQFWAHPECAHSSVQRLEDATSAAGWSSPLPPYLEPFLRIPRILPIDPSYVPFPGSPRQRNGMIFNQA